MDKEVAITILNQLGGRRFQLMTGAKNFLSTDRSLQFRFPRSKGVNSLQITLDAMDTYELKFRRIHGMKVTEVATHEGVYADQLQATFTEVTGLYTRF